MSVSFAYCSQKSGLMSHTQQAHVMATLELLSSVPPGKDATNGALATAVSGGWERNPSPQITQPDTAFIIQSYFSPKVPGADKTTAMQGLVIQLVLNSKYYVVLSLYNSTNPNGYEWAPFAVDLMGTTSLLAGDHMGIAPPRSVDTAHSVNAVRNVRQGPTINIADPSGFYGFVEEDQSGFYGFVGSGRALPPIPTQQNVNRMRPLRPPRRDLGETRPRPPRPPR